MTIYEWFFGTKRSVLNSNTEKTPEPEQQKITLMENRLAHLEKFKTSRALSSEELTEVLNLQLTLLKFKLSIPDNQVNAPSTVATKTINNK